MADIKKLFDNLSELWAVGLGVVGGIIAAWKFGRSYGLRFIRALRLSDAVFAYFGPGAAKQLVEEVRNRAREGIIRESRLQLVETQLDLAIYVCSGDGKCEWVNNEVAELL